MKRVSKLLLLFMTVFALCACGSAAPPQGSLPAEPVSGSPVQDGTEESLPEADGGNLGEDLEEERGSAQPEALPESGFQGDPVQDGTEESLLEADGGNLGEDLEESLLPEDGTYASRDDVALYIHQYGHLPSNFITKKEAEKLGWEGGSLEPYAPGKCIGGGRFGNYEGLLPEKEGRAYTECDIDTLGARKRGAKRIVFSNDGLIYYTEDHYESFELLYGEE